jgi:hypothetical protein
MPGVESYSIEPDENTETTSEGMSPGQVNDAIRQMKADIALFMRDARWVEYGKGSGAGNGGNNYSVTYVDADSFTLADGDYTDQYVAGRQIRAFGTLAGYIYGTLASSSHNAGDNRTTVGVDWVIGGLVNESGIRVWLSTLVPNGLAFPIACIEDRAIDMGRYELSRPQVKNYSEARQTLEIDAGAVVWDLADGNAAYLKLTEDVNSVTITGWAGNPQASSASLTVQQDGTGNRTLTGWPSEVKWLGGNAPTITVVAHAADKVVLETYDGGANILGSFGQGALFAEAIG